MSAQVIAHPASVDRALHQARQIIGAKDGSYEDGQVLDACEFLMAHGTQWDHLRASTLHRILVDIAVGEMNAEAGEQVRWSLAETARWSFAEGVAAAYAVLVIAFVAVAVWL